MYVDNSNTIMMFDFAFVQAQRSLAFGDKLCCISGRYLTQPSSGTGVQLRCRLGRNVDGLDEDLFEGALKLRRRFESKMNATPIFDS